MEASEYSLKQYYHYLIDLLNANEINEIRLEYLEVNSYYYFFFLF